MRMDHSIQMQELQRHVYRLAVDIGERHIRLPAKLREAVCCYYAETYGVAHLEPDQVLILHGERS